MLRYYSSIILISWMALLSLSTLIHENAHIASEDKRLLYLTYVLIFLSSLSEWLGVHMNHWSSVPTWALKAVKCADYILTPLAGGTLLAQMRIRNRWQIVLYGILIANTVFQIVAVFNGWMITIDPEGHYMHGPYQKDLMAFASSLDGSPATFIASLMYQSIIQCHPENRLPLVCGMQHQFRKALGKPFSHLCHVNVVPIIYPDRLKKWGIERLNTAARGQLILGADDQNDILTVNAHIRNEKMIRDMSLSRKHDYMRKVVLDGIGTNTFEVSYTGRVPWSGLDKYITNVVPYFDLTLSGGISIEIFSVGDVFSVNIMQRNGDRQYVDCITALLEEAGVAYVAEEPEHFQLSGFQLPE